MLKQALHKSERRYADYTFFSGIVCTQANKFPQKSLSSTLSLTLYSRVPNKRGDGNNRGGWKWFDIAIIKGVGTIGRGGCLEK